MTNETTTDSLHCPKCDSTMQAVPADYGQHVHRCENCHGLFCSESALNAMQRAWFERPQDSPEKDIDTGIDATAPDYNARGEITCPACGTWMRDVSADDQPDIWFEHCSGCGGAFFDAGELSDLRYETLTDTVHDLARPRSK